jgi:hypothetical protein
MKTRKESVDDRFMKLIDTILSSFDEASKLAHGDEIALTEEELLAFEAAYNRVRYYMGGLPADLKSK